MLIHRIRWSPSYDRYFGEGAAGKRSGIRCKLFWSGVCGEQIFRVSSAWWRKDHVCGAAQARQKFLVQGGCDVIASGRYKFSKYIEDYVGSNRSANCKGIGAFARCLTVVVLGAAGSVLQPGFQFHTTSVKYLSLLRQIHWLRLLELRPQANYGGLSS